jgi:NADH-quinone oxidoreductase subunit N
MNGIDWTLLIPHFSMGLWAVITLLCAAWRGERSMPCPVAGWLSVVGCGVTIALCTIYTNWGTVGQGMFIWDPFAAFFCIVFAISAMLVALGSVSSKVGGEFYTLILLSTLGMMFMATSGNLLMLYLSLELATMCLFVLAGYYRDDSKSGEAALKFLIVGGSSSAVLLFGVSWIYGAVGATDYRSIAQFFAGDVPGYAWAGLVLVIAAFCFKIAAAPFHLWAPDVYEGAPTRVTAFLSTASKAAGLVALLRLLTEGLGSTHTSWAAIIVVLSAVTMVLGNLVALVQTNIKRLLAYSSISQAGFLLIAVASASKLGTMAMGLYLLLYVFANVGAFLCVTAVSEKTGDHDLRSYDGLSRRSPVLAFAFLIFLLSLGGIPPLAGFVGKWFVFTAGMESGLWGLVLFGAVASTASLYYYLIVAKRMYIHEPPENAPPLKVAPTLSLAIGVCVLMTAVIGIYPAPWMEIAQKVAGMH